MHRISTLLFVLIGIGCGTVDDQIIIDENTYSTFEEFRNGVNKMICDSIDFRIELNVKDNLYPMHYCETDKIIIREINYFSISETQYARFQFQISDSLLLMELEDYIMNPKRREYNAIKPEKAFVMLQLKDTTSTKELFKQLNRISSIFDQIRKKYSLDKKLSIRFRSSAEKPFPKFITN